MQYVVLVAVAIYVVTHAGGITKFLQDKGWIKVQEGVDSIKTEEDGKILPMR